MLFNSIDFVFFLPIVVVLYYLTPQRFRWILLLAASYVFYMFWKVEYIVLILFSTLVDYLCGRAMASRPEKKQRRPFLVLSLFTNLGLLLTYKYGNFFTGNFNGLLSMMGVEQELPMLELLLPVGISFYTFQTLSYSIDVYKGEIEAEKHLGYFALYVSFFPQLVAGPIERFSRLEPQFKTRHLLSYDNVSNGMRLILFGLFIKMVIADNLAQIVDSLYASPTVYDPLSVATGLVFYSFQIYGDFFGYSIIAVGSARLLGIDLMDNFRTPYLAKNIAEFWQRWHISLSTWFRDYVYYPLGGNRTSTLKWAFNIMVVFLVSGFWHGANWTFIFWGGLYGAVYLLENKVSKVFPIKDRGGNFSPYRVLLMVKNFVVVTLIWVFFRSQSLEEAFSIFTSLVTFDRPDTISLDYDYSILFFLGVLILSDLLFYRSRYDIWIASRPLLVRWASYGFLIYAIIVYASVQEFSFIYFQF
jgi:alginate O-acetyltransferase complex protein AlgI